MNIEEIRKNAPSGATMYRFKMLSSGVIYYKPDASNKLSMWSNRCQDWIDAFNTTDNENIINLY